jgi:hypothetical protein
MNGSTKIRLLLLGVSLAFAGGSARAQDPQQEPPPSQEPPMEQTTPKPAARGIPSLDDQNNDQNDANSWRPDTTPATGLEQPTLGTPTLRHSYWVPGGQYGLMVQSNPFGGKNAGWFSSNFIGGSLSLMKEWPGSTLAINYSGGGVIVSQGAQQFGQQSGTYQQLGAGQSFQFRRWSWQWSDQFAYLPEAQFGFGAGTALALPGVGGSLGATDIGGLTPNQSIFTATGTRYSNNVILQGTYDLSARQSVTVAGADGVLHFNQAQNVNSDNYLGSVGYNYGLTQHDSIGITYRFNAFHFPGQGQAYGDSSINAVYLKEITQRLALELSAGPDFISYRFAVVGSTKQTGARANADLSYAFKEGTIGAVYVHGLSTGSGVLIGGQLDQLTLNGTRLLGRVWKGTGSFGLAHNAIVAGATGTTVGSTSFNNYFASAGVSRPIGRQVDFAAAYLVYIEHANSPAGCTGATCGLSYTQHTINISLSWHARPFVLE